MKAKFDVSVRSVNEINELPNSWTIEDYKEVLELADFEDWDEIDENELKDYTLLSLQEFEADEAAELILHYRLGDHLKSGQIQNMAQEMMDEKLWEEYQDIRLHKDLFACASLLHAAFPNKFPEAEAVKCNIEVTAKNPFELEFLKETDKTLLTRLLANGMDNHAIINRLFDEQVAGRPFPEAESIIWQHEKVEKKDSVLFTIYSSQYWLHGMDEVTSYTSEAFSDLTNAL
ncbi:hypothetical protein [Ekhidna sp.]|uniref:hypothetical protein n=1 Tax=Ekhidna sp. TaxID=2608089 RepID=UPI003BA9C2E7